ncbi:MAG TPA: GNAT family N-acetyltransferase [Actinomycetota bacterium]|nr:GNAT family N-acetyltransferase [Actinomycetota bacterium]
MRVELTEDPTAFVALDWTDLVEADPSGSFFHTPAYLKLWWEEFGSGRLLLARVLNGAQPVAACALEVLGDTLVFLGGFDVTDYLGPVGLPGAEEAAAKELVGALLADGGWVRADLRGLPEDSRWLGALEEALRGHGLGVERTDDVNGVAPYLLLPGSFEEYLAAIPGKLRHEIRRKRRRLAQEAGEYRVRFADPATLSADLDRFVELHRASPGPKGKFMHAGMEIFFRRLGEAFQPPHVFHLAFLEVGGRAAAGAIGFGFKRSFSLYNSAFDREFAHLSPGMVLVSELIRLAIEAGREVFDLLKGDLEYKYRFGARPRRVLRLVVSR